MKKDRNNLIASVARNFIKTCDANRMTIQEAAISIGLVVNFFSENTNIPIEEIQTHITNVAKTAAANAKQ